MSEEKLSDIAGQGYQGQKVCSKHPFGVPPQFSACHIDCLECIPPWWNFLLRRSSYDSPRGNFDPPSNPEGTDGRYWDEGSLSTSSCSRRVSEFDDDSVNCSRKASRECDEDQDSPYFEHDNDYCSSREIIEQHSCFRGHQKDICGFTRNKNGFSFDVNDKDLKNTLENKKECYEFREKDTDVDYVDCPLNEEYCTDRKKENSCVFQDTKEQFNSSCRKLNSSVHSTNSKIHYKPSIYRQVGQGHLSESVNDLENSLLLSKLSIHDGEMHTSYYYETNSEDLPYLKATDIHLPEVPNSSRKTDQDYRSSNLIDLQNSSLHFKSPVQENAKEYLSKDKTTLKEINDLKAAPHFTDVPNPFRQTDQEYSSNMTENVKNVSLHFKLPIHGSTKQSLLCQESTQEQPHLIGDGIRFTEVPTPLRKKSQEYLSSNQPNPETPSLLFGQPVCNHKTTPKKEPITKATDVHRTEQPNLKSTDVHRTEVSKLPRSFQQRDSLLEDVLAAKKGGWRNLSRTSSLESSSSVASLASDCTCDDCFLEIRDKAPKIITKTKDKKSSHWRKVRNVVQWTPFVQTYKRHKYPWVQLAGHQGNFRAGEKQGTILKRFCPQEQLAFDALMVDVLRPYVPVYMGVDEWTDGEKYLQLQDLLSGFRTPCVMDIKMGVRTYLEEELAKARHKPKLRKDMYEKMTQIDAKAPTEAEHQAKAVTKPRYMVWRETISSTANLGFRIEGVRRADGTSSKDFKTTRTRDQVLTALYGFLKGYPKAITGHIRRLKEIRLKLEKSAFFRSHELIGSSLLFVHNEEKANVWMIDFAKTMSLPSEVSVTHRVPWKEGSHEDGYLIGLDNLIDLFETLEAKETQLEKHQCGSGSCSSGCQKSTNVISREYPLVDAGVSKTVEPSSKPCACGKHECCCGSNCAKSDNVSSEYITSASFGEASKDVEPNSITQPHLEALSNSDQSNLSTGYHQTSHIESSSIADTKPLNNENGKSDITQSLQSISKAGFSQSSESTNISDISQSSPNTVQAKFSVHKNTSVSHDIKSRPVPYPSTT